MGDVPLDESIIRDAERAIAGDGPVRLNYQVQNTHRAVGTQLSSRIAIAHGSRGLPDGTIELNLSGSAGQSLGAFLMKGVRIRLAGEANDYVGKGLSGGEISVRPVDAAKFRTHENSIIGNTVLYGATSGALYAAGQAGERFCVRSSGANAVVEGVGDHGCEYMTGGTVIVLGRTGRNFGAGMTGGIAYILDEEKKFEGCYNPRLVVIQRLLGNGDIKIVRGFIEKHWEFTKSQRARDVLDHWDRYQPMFWKVIPKETLARLAKESPVAIGG